MAECNRFVLYIHSMKYGSRFFTSSRGVIFPKRYPFAFKGFHETLDKGVVVRIP